MLGVYIGEDGGGLLIRGPWMYHYGVKETDV